MAPADQETQVAPPVEEPEEMPLPSDPKVIFLGGLFVLALLATAYVASEIVLPLVFAIILNLLLQPALRLLERFHVPRMVAALLLILALFGTIVGLGTAISGPASTWAAKLPEGISRPTAAGVEVRAICPPNEFIARIEGIFCSGEITGGHTFNELMGRERTFRNEDIVLRSTDLPSRLR
jgi:hypothetical protein